MKFYQILMIIVTLCIPLPSNQHFIFPLKMCLLADICNHTWIPECGQDNTSGVPHMRLFLDECDMFEYNCDNEKLYVLQNYSDCFKVSACPTAPPCPSRPTCPNHRFHRMGQRYIFLTEDARRMARPPKTTLRISLPYHMLHGKRRYTPIPRIRRERIEKEARRKAGLKFVSKTQSTKKTNSLRESIILRSETFVRKGTIFMRIIKKIFTKPMTRRCTTGCY